MKNHLFRHFLLNCLFTLSFSFTIFNPLNARVTDIDCNNYNIVQIGSQLWMAENLKTIHYNDGAAIEDVGANTEWHNNTKGENIGYNKYEIIYLPELVTSEAGSITQITAISGGNISYDGGASITARGVCWNTSPNPTISNSLTNDGVGAGSFTSSLSGLTPGDTYFLRAYATNSAGTAYGNEVYFTTPAVIQKATTAAAADGIIDAGDPWIEGNWIDVSLPGTNNTSNDMSARLQLMYDETNLYFAAVITDGTRFTGNATTYLNDCIEFFIDLDTTSLAGVYKTGTRQLRLQAVDNPSEPGGLIECTQVASPSGSFVCVDNGTNYVQEWIMPWSELSEGMVPEWDHKQFKFDIQISDATADGTRTQQMFWNNNSDMQWINTTKFGLITLESPIPYIIVNLPLTGEFWLSGEQRTIEWKNEGVNQDEIIQYTLDGGNTWVDIDNVLSPVNGINTYNWTVPYVTGLINDAKIRVISGDGSVIGSGTAFTISNLTTSSALLVTSNTASCGGNLYSDGGFEVTACGVCWSKSTNPTIADSKTSDILVAGAFTSSITGLAPNTLYYARAYVTSINGTVYGNEIPFTTLLPHAVIKQAATAPVIDGLIDAVWADASANNIDQPFTGETPTLGAPGETTWKALWTLDGLYILLQVTDDIWQPAYSGTSPQTFWMYDQPEINIDVNEILQDGFGPSSGAGHHQVIPTFASGLIDGTPVTTLDGVIHSFLVSDPNYTAEYFIPFSKLLNKDGNEFLRTATLGFDICIADGDTPEPSRNRAVWSNTGIINESYVNMDGCGTVSFEGADEIILTTEITVSSAGNATTISTDNGALQMSISILPADATYQTAKWTVSNGTGMASISSDGILTALTNGTVTVIATAKDGTGISGSKEITISNQVVTLDEVNIIKDGGFATDGPISYPWTIWTGNGGTAEVSGGVCIMTPAAPAEVWQLQVIQSDWVVSNDSSYALIFTAWSDANRDFIIDMDDPNNSYNRFGSSTDPEALYGRSEWRVPLTPTPTTFTFYTTIDGVQPNTKFSLNIQTSGATDVVYIDDIYLLREMFAPPDITVYQPSAGTSMLTGEQINIEWKSLKPDQNVNLEYSVDSGLSWLPIINNVTPVNGINNYLWTLPSVSGTQNNSMVRVITADGTVSGTSKIFTIKTIVYVSGINIKTPGDVTVIATEGGTLQLNAEILPADATYKNFKWSLVNGSGRASLSADGLLTAIVDGTVTVTATAEDGSLVVGTKDITISNQFVSMSDINVIKNGNFNLVNPDGTATFWGGWGGDANSPLPQIIDGIAVCTPVATVYNWQYQFSQSGLNAIPGVDYTLSFKAWSDANRTITVDFEDSPENNYNRYGSSPDPEAAEGRSDWTFDITTSPTKYSFTVNFDQIIETTLQKFQFMMGLASDVVYIDSITLINPDDLALLGTEVSGITVTGAGGATIIDTDHGTLQMFADILPVDAGFKEVSWSVQHGTGIATISSDGLLSALSNGTVTVTASAKDDSGVTGSLEITLSNQTSPVHILNVDMTGAGLAAGDKVYITGNFWSWIIPGGNSGLEMFDTDEDGIYSIALSFSPGEWKFKFFRNAGWENGEPISADRAYTFNESITLNLIWGVDNVLPDASWPIDFETVTDAIWEVFANGTGDPLSDFTVVDNPDKSGINTSGKVLKFIVNDNADPWTGAWSDNYGPMEITEERHTVTMMVWKSIISNTGFKLEGSTNGGPIIEIKVPNTLVNQWELLTFDFSDAIGYSYPRVVFFPDFPDVRTTGCTVFLDNFSFPFYPPAGIIKKATTVPVIDGIIDPVWATANSYNIHLRYRQESPTLGEKGTTYWKGLWTNEGIYLLVKVNDDIFFPAYAGMDAGSTWLYDKPEIWFDVNQILDDGFGPSYGMGHHQVAPPFIESQINGELIDWGNGVTYAYKVTNPVYIAEYFIPFTLLLDKEGVEVPKIATMGFDVTLIDRDVEGTERQRAVWSNIGLVEESWNNMDDCGTITLEGAEAGVLVSGITVSSTGGVSTIETDGGSLQMIADVLPANATNPAVTWTVTSGTGKAAIDSDGLLTALYNGTVTVTARSMDGSYILSSKIITISNQVVTDEEAAAMVFSLIGDAFYMPDGVTLAVWNYDIDMTYLGTSENKSTYRINSQNLLQNGQFKIRRDHQWTESYGFDELTILGDITNFVKQDINIKALSGKTYEITFIADWEINKYSLALYPLPPTITTTAVSSITSGSAISGGEIISEPGSTITARGVCWSTNQNPTVSDFHTTNGSGTGPFTSILNGLTPLNRYYYRAYATTSLGTYYGNESYFYSLNHVASITSFIYSINQGTSSITNVPLSETLAVFKNNIVLPHGATLEVYQSDGATVATDLQTGYKLKVTAQDVAFTKTYAITLNTITSNEAVLIAFNIAGLDATIDPGTKTVSATLPYGTSVTNLAATFTISGGATAKVGTTSQTSGVNTNNFTNPVVYIITAEDGTTSVNWTVSVSVAVPGTDATLSSVVYSVDNAAGTIINVLYNTPLAVFKANLIHATGATFQVYQSNGTTVASDLQTGYKVKVTAQDGTTTKIYSLTLTGGGTAASDTEICSGSSASLTLTGYTGNIQWQQSADGTSMWTNVSGGTGSNSASYTTANLTSTTYYRAKVSEPGFTEIYSNTVMVKVTSLPASAISISGPATICVGQNSVTYTVSPVENATSYVWTLPADVTGSSTTNSITVDFNPAFVSDGITVSGKNACGIGNSFLLAVSALQLPVNAGIITGETSICQGETSLTYTLPVISNATSYIWTLPAGVNGTSATNSITVDYSLTSVSGNITVKGSNTCGNGGSSSLAVTVSPLPASAGSIVGPSNVCQGEANVTYTATTIANADTYLWTLPDGITGSSTTRTIKLNFSNSAVSDTIFWRGHNSCGDGESGEVIINVNPIPAAAGVISGSTVVCEGQNSVTYTVPVIANATLYSWTLPSGATGTSTANNINISFAVSFVSGTIEVKGSNNCGTGASSTLAVSEMAKPAAAGAITGPAAACVGENSITYTVPSIQNASSYVWTLPTGVSGSSTTNSIDINFNSAFDVDAIEVYGMNSCYDGNASSIAIKSNSVPANAGAITGLTNVCLNQNSVIYNVTTIANATEYVWTLPDGATGTLSAGGKFNTVDFGPKAVSGTMSVKGRNSCDGVASSIDIDVIQPFQEEQVCIITIDEETGKNMIVWEKTADANIASYNVYREASTGISYNVLKNISVDSLSVYVDMTSDPETKSQKYYITAIDNCGNESEPSDWHRPMLLTSSLGTTEATVNLNWAEYETQSGVSTNLLFTNYIIYRDIVLNTLTPIDTIPLDNHLYIDRNAPVGVDLHYRIAGIKLDPCDPADILGKKASSGPFVHSLSNLEDNRLNNPPGVNNPLANALQLYIYPSPFSDHTNITYTLDKPAKMKVDVYNVIGEKIMTLLDEKQSPGSHLVKMKAADVNFKPGAYYIRICLDDAVIIRKTILTR